MENPYQKFRALVELRENPLAREALGKYREISSEVEKRGKAWKIIRKIEELAWPGGKKPIPCIDNKVREITSLFLASTSEKFKSENLAARGEDELNNLGKFLEKEYQKFCTELAPIWQTVLKILKEKQAEFSRKLKEENLEAFFDLDYRKNHPRAKINLLSKEKETLELLNPDQLGKTEKTKNAGEVFYLDPNGLKTTLKLFHKILQFKKETSEEKDALDQKINQVKKEAPSLKKKITDILNQWPSGFTLGPFSKGVIENWLKGIDFKGELSASQGEKIWAFYLKLKLVVEASLIYQKKPQRDREIIQNLEDESQKGKTNKEQAKREFKKCHEEIGEAQKYFLEAAAEIPLNLEKVKNLHQKLAGKIQLLGKTRVKYLGSEETKKLEKTIRETRGENRRRTEEKVRRILDSLEEKKFQLTKLKAKKVYLGLKTGVLFFSKGSKEKIEAERTELLHQQNDLEEEIEQRVKIFKPYLDQAGETILTNRKVLDQLLAFRKSKGAYSSATRFLLKTWTEEAYRTRQENKFKDQVLNGEIPPLESQKLIIKQEEIEQKILVSQGKLEGIESPSLLLKMWLLLRGKRKRKEVLKGYRWYLLELEAEVGALRKSVSSPVPDKEVTPEDRKERERFLKKLKELTALRKKLRKEENRLLKLRGKETSLKRKRETKTREKAREMVGLDTRRAHFGIKINEIMKKAA